MTGSRGRVRVRQEDDRVKSGWLDGEQFMKITGLGVLYGIVG